MYRIIVTIKKDFLQEVFSVISKLDCIDACKGFLYILQ